MRVDQLEEQVYGLDHAHSEIDLWWGDKVPRREGESLYMRIRRVWEVVGGDMEVCVADAHRYAQVVYNPVATSGECPFCKVLKKVAHEVNAADHELDYSGDEESLVVTVESCTLADSMRKLLVEPT